MSNRNSLLDALNDRDSAAHMTRSAKQRRARRIGVLSTATATVASALLYTAATSGHNNADASSSRADNTKVTCEVPVRPKDTISGLADTLDIAQSKIKIYPPNSTTPETNPVETMQPGDRVVAEVGAAVCAAAGGMPGDPAHDGVIVE